MSPAEASKLRKGDRILVKMTVKDVNTIDGIVTCMSTVYPTSDQCIDTDYIVVVLSKHLEVGDRVKYAKYDIGTIISIFNEYAFVKWDNHPMPEVYYLSDLHFVKEEEKLVEQR